jgi:hypothetical protein
MRLKKTLNDLVRAIVEETEKNSEFSKRIEEALGLQEKAPKPVGSRATHRRAPAVLDPVELARRGEPTLRANLAQLNLEQLKDIVADYGMDPGKLVLKWKTTDRIINRIIEVAIGRAKKGEGFLSSGSSREPPR